MNDKKRDEEAQQIPSRRTLHSSNKVRWTRRFYFSLVVLLFILTLSLIGWFYWFF